MIGASTRLEVLENDFRALTDSNKAEESLASARTELKEWQNEFQSRVGSDVRRRLKAAKTEWVAIGFARGEKRGRAAGRKAGFAAGKEAGYDTGYSNGLADALLESGDGADGGGSSGNCNPNYSGCLIATPITTALAEAAMGRTTRGPSKSSATTNTTSIVTATASAVTREANRPQLAVES